MSYPQWKDNPSELVSTLRHAAMDAVLGQGGIVGDALYAKAADEIQRLTSYISDGANDTDRLRWFAEMAHDLERGDEAKETAAEVLCDRLRDFLLRSIDGGASPYEALCIGIDRTKAGEVPE